MKKPFLTAGICLLAVLASPFAEAQKKSGSIALFNGRNLDGWYKYLKSTGKDKDPLNVFSVKNGEIHISGEDYGSIITRGEYENYRLVVEYRWGQKTFAPRADRARDNGVLIHSVGKEGAFSGSWMYSIECQLIEGGSGDFLVVGDGSPSYALTANVAPQKQAGAYLYQSGGKPATIHSGRINWFARSPEWKDVLNFRGAHDIEKPVGEWNRLEVIALNGQVDMFLNQRLVNQAYNVVPSRGKIQIQSEGAEMFVRKVLLTPLKNYEPQYLNRPATVRAASDGILRLRAQSGTGTGPKIKYMPEWEAFGWFTAADQVSWQAEVPRNGEYEVFLEWSVSDDSAGNPYVFGPAADPVLKGKVESTGSWETFRYAGIGRIKLKKGLQKLVFKADPGLREGGMLDLREIRLVPVK